MFVAAERAVHTGGKRCRAQDRTPSRDGNLVLYVVTGFRRSLEVLAEKFARAKNTRDRDGRRAERSLHAAAERPSPLCVAREHAPPCITVLG